METPIFSKPLRVLALTAGIALVLGGCGGDSDSDPIYVSKSKPALSGTAAVGAAITGATVTAKCADDTGFTTSPVTTDANGNWRGVIDSAALPCALQVSGGTPSHTLYSYASSTGTVNITPLTTLALAQATSSVPTDWFANFDGTPVDVTTAAEQLMDALEDAGFTLPSGGNAFNTPFVADGTGWDGLLDDLKEAITEDPALNDLDDLVTLVKDGNLNTSIPDAPADDEPVDPEAPANIDVLTAYAGTYTVSCTAVEPAARGTATRDHARGTVIIGENGAIDFDTGAEFNFSVADVGEIFDRTMLEGDIRRVHINYDEDDSGRRIDIYLNDTLAVTEIRYLDGAGGTTRAAVGGDSNCAGDTGDDGLGDSNGASAEIDGVAATHTAYIQSLSNYNPNDNGFNFIAKDANNFSSFGWNIQGRLLPGDQSCDNDVVFLARYQDSGSMDFATNCTINITTVPSYEDATPYIIEGTFSGELSIGGETVSVTNGVFRYLTPL